MSRSLGSQRTRKERNPRDFDRKNAIMLSSIVLIINRNTIVRVIFARLNFYDFARFNPAENFAKLMFARVGQYYEHVSD